MLNTNEHTFLLRFSLSAEIPDEAWDDEDFEGDWVRVDTATKSKTEVRITLQDDIKQWVQENNVQLDQLIEKLLDGFYRAQKMTSEKA